MCSRMEQRKTMLEMQPNHQYATPLHPPNQRKFWGLFRTPPPPPPHLVKKVYFFSKRSTPSVKDLLLDLRIVYWSRVFVTITLITRNWSRSIRMFNIKLAVALHNVWMRFSYISFASIGQYWWTASQHNLRSHPTCITGKECTECNQCITMYWISSLAICHNSRLSVEVCN